VRRAAPWRQRRFSCHWRCANTERHKQPSAGPERRHAPGRGGHPVAAQRRRRPVRRRDRAADGHGHLHGHGRAGGRQLRLPRPGAGLGRQRFGLHDDRRQRPQSAGAAATADVAQRHCGRRRRAGPAMELTRGRRGDKLSPRAQRERGRPVRCRAANRRRDHPDPRHRTRARRDVLLPRGGAQRHGREHSLGGAQRHDPPADPRCAAERYRVALFSVIEHISSRRRRYR